ncbi:MAG: class I SAM-dependent methyltransferase [Pseudomonadota bacterium]|nr:class I SAM-dependent methyltransferase [Pseudomonadota bacterium]
MSTQEISHAILMRMFGRPKGGLGRLGGIIMARMNRKVAAWAIDLLAVHPSDRALEVGFGPGVGIQLLAESASSGQVVGVDPSKEMVEQAAVRNAKAIKANRVNLREGSVEQLPFEDAFFNSALAVNSMQVWPDAVAGLREIRRVLKTGGRIALAFTRHSGQPKSGLTDALVAADFRGARLTETDDGFCVLATKP